jgi:hypothetical protein
MTYPIARIINLIPACSQCLWSMTETEAAQRLIAADPDAVLKIDGSFALVARDGERVMLARSLARRDPGAPRARYDADVRAAAGHDRHVCPGAPGPGAARRRERTAMTADRDRTVRRWLYFPSVA